MIDTIIIAKRIDFDLEYLLKIEAKAYLVKRKKLKNMYLQVYHRNMNITFTDEKVKVKGSVSSSVNSCNSKRITFMEFKDWVIDLSEFLELDVTTFYISRLDLNFDLPVKYPTRIYQRIFHDVSSLTSFQQDRNTIYAKGYAYTVKVYDKKLKALNPSKWTENNMRIEFSFFKNLGMRLFGESRPVLVRDIINKQGYSTLYQVAIRLFNRISIYNTDCILPYQDATNFKEVRDVILAEWTQLKGGAIKIAEWIESLKCLDMFKNKRGYARLKAQLLEGEKFESTEDLVGEIKTLFFSLVRYRI